ncbi:hypothetical protein IL308_12440 [Lactococcus lactis]|uniref:hypothetical protein n=1 Tax=Lactococcus lactis TaxID=1358 RepID=UPI001914CF74|nr:hypothetical protein [Lactococcus lactis]MBK5077556.1 hypothetical protein [Lactococcus lactis]WDA67290.1 hypothetical protein IL310_00560 [Lactococcus lactis]
MENDYLEDEHLPTEVKESLVLLLKLADEESRHFIKFRGTKSKGVYYLIGKSSNMLHCICSCERTVITQVNDKILDISVAQFILDLDLFYRMRKQIHKPKIPLIPRTHQALLDFLDTFPLFKKQFNQKVKLMIDDNDSIIKQFYDDTETTYP